MTSFTACAMPAATECRVAGLAGRARMNLVGKIAACWSAFALALVAAGLWMHVLGMRQVHLPSGVSPNSALAMAAAAGVVLVLGLTPLATGLTGPKGAKGTAMFAFLFLALGINTTLEAQAFTHMVDNAVPSQVLLSLLQAALLGGALALCFGGEETASGLVRSGWPGRAVRVISAWLLFPVIWWIFGMCVTPIVMPYYRAGVAGLHIPPMGTILNTELLRSVLFLLGSLPLIALWKGTRGRLWVALGLAQATVVGYFGLVQATFLPWVVRIAHGLEITADSFVYAAVLVVLFPRKEVPVEAMEPEETAMA